MTWYMYYHHITHVVLLGKWSQIWSSEPIQEKKNKIIKQCRRMKGWIQESQCASIVRLVG